MITYIEAGEKAYQVNYTINSLCAYEDRFGKDIAAALSKMTVSDLRGALWAGLIDKQPEITLEGTGEIMDDFISGGEKNLGDILNMCMEALTNSGFFKRAGNKKNPATKNRKAKG